MPKSAYANPVGVPDGLLASFYLTDASKVPLDWVPRDLDAVITLVRSWIGTGGCFAEYAGTHPAGTSGYTAFRSEPKKAHAAALDDTADKIALIRSTLSFNVKELAAVLQVKRPTVYAWIAGTAQPQQLNRRRIDTVVALAREWAKLDARPLGALRKESGQDSSSAMELLECDEIDTGKVRRLFAAAAAKLKQEKKAVKGIGLAERAKARGITFTAPPDAQREIDRLTGSRIAPE